MQRALALFAGCSMTTSLLCACGGSGASVDGLAPPDALDADAYVADAHLADAHVADAHLGDAHGDGADVEDARARSDAKPHADADARGDVAAETAAETDAPDDGPPLVDAPLSGAAPGEWQAGDVTASGMTMHFNYLLPHGYDTTHRYPLLVWLHENDMGDAFYDGGDPYALAGYLDGWFNNGDFRAAYPCIVVAPYADQRSDPGGETSNFGGWVPPGDHGANEDAVVAVTTHFIHEFSVYPRKVYVTGASLGGIGSWALMLDYNATNGPFGKVFTAGMPFAGVIERYGFGVDPPADIVDRMREVPIFAVHGAGDGESQPNWDRAMWRDEGGADFPGAPGAAAPTGAFHYLEDPSLGHDVWDTYYPLPAGAPLYDWLFAQTSP